MHLVSVYKSGVRLLATLLAITTIQSCSLIGLNIYRKSPVKAREYPKFGYKDSLVGYLYADRASYRPYYYNLDIDFNISAKSIEGKAEIYFEAEKSLNSIQLNLNPNMKIHSIQCDGKEIAYTRKYTALWLTFNNPIESGTRKIITVKYGGKPEIARRPPWEGGFVWKKDKNKNPWIGVACEKVGANLWWPLNDHLSFEPDSTTLTLRVPEGLTAVSNGVMTAQSTQNGKSAFTWQTHYPINSYNLTFYIGKYETFALPYGGDDTKIMRFYVLNYNLEKAKVHFKQADRVIRSFEKFYGEYPYWKDEYKLVESPYEGMEHQTAIAYGNGYKNNYMGIDYIILHETAHEWWGNSVSVADYADIWIHEGIATYSEALFVEERGGIKGYSGYINMYAYSIKNKRPMVGPRNVSFWDYKDPDPYTKGALMLHSLRNTIKNDTLFKAILREFYQRHKYGFATSEDFVNLVNEMTGKDYRWFFNQYLYNHRPPKLEYSIVKNEKANKQTIYYKWVNTSTEFVMPVNFLDNYRESIPVIPTVSEQSFTTDLSSEITPDLHCAYFAAKKVKRKKH